MLRIAFAVVLTTLKSIFYAAAALLLLFIVRTRPSIALRTERPGIQVDFVPGVQQQCTRY